MASPSDARAAFAADGLARVEGVVSAAEARAMRDAVLAAVVGCPLIELAGALRPGPGSEALLWSIGRQPVFAPLVAGLARAADEVFGPGQWAQVEGEHGGLAAPNFPLAGRPWDVPDRAWHVDEPTAAGQAMSWGLLGFAFLDEVVAGGGATVAIAGSHRRLLALAAELGRGPGTLLTTDDALAALAAEPWFAELVQPGDPAARRARYLGVPYQSAGVALRLVELTGRPGDLVFMDPRCLHTVSGNASTRPRLTMRLTCGRA